MFPPMSLRRRLSRLVLMIVLIVGLGGCQLRTAPREFAPDGAVIERAMRHQLDNYYWGLSRTIGAAPPDLHLKNIQVTTLDSFFLKQLPVYHLRGTYDLELTFSAKTEQRRKNPFDLYLQRQREGKTWRSLEKTDRGWRSSPIGY